MGELARGMHDVGRGFAFLGSHPRLWKWVLAPAVVTIVLLAAIVLLLVAIATRVIGGITEHLPDAIAGAAGTLLGVLLVVALVTVAIFVFVTMAGAIAGPFCEQLSEAVEEELTGKPGTPFALGRFLGELAVGIGHALRRLVSALFGALLLFALSFVPVVGAIASVVLGGYFAARAAAYDCYDSVFGRRAFAYADKLAYLRAHRARSLGLGAVIASLLLVPVVNLVALGVGAIGATLAMHDRGA